MRLFLAYILWIFLVVAVVSGTVHEEEDEDEEFIEQKDRPELEQCRELNKGKWCTCRKLAKYIQDHLMGKKLGIYIPECGRFKKKLFALKQCFNNEQSCWCVNPKSGRLIVGTKIQGREAIAMKCEPNQIKNEL